MAVRIIYACNNDYLNDMKADKFPQLLRSVVLKHVTRLNLKMIQALAFISTQRSIVTITGAAAGDWVLRFVGSYAGGGAAFDVTLAAYAAGGGDTTSDIANGLEAIIETARATTLAGIVSGESDAANVITVDYTAGVTCTITLTAPGAGTATITRTFTAIIDQTTRLNSWPVMPEFFDRVIRGPCILHKIVAVTGLTAVTIIVGDANDDNGMFTSLTLTTTGSSMRPGAEEQRRYEAAFRPQITLVATTDPFSSATAGEFMVEIEHVPVPMHIGNAA